MKAKLLAGTTAFAWAVVFAIAPTLMPLAYAGVIACLGVIIGVVVYQKRRRRFDDMMESWLHQQRGVVSVSCGRNRAEQFSEPWQKAMREIFCWGVGMTNIVHDEKLIEDTVKGQRSIVFEMIDPVWLRARPDLCELLDVTYNRTNLVDQIDQALEQLVRMRDRLNKRYGRDKVQIFVVQHYQGQSGTVADPHLPSAVGYIEHHTMGFPHGQTRVKAILYESPNPATEPAYLEYVLNSRRLLPRQRVGKKATDREERKWRTEAA